MAKKLGAKFRVWQCHARFRHHTYEFLLARFSASRLKLILANIGLCSFARLCTSSFYVHLLLLLLIIFVFYHLSIWRLAIFACMPHFRHYWFSMKDAWLFCEFTTSSLFILSWWYLFLLPYFIVIILISSTFFNLTNLYRFPLLSFFGWITTSLVSSKSLNIEYISFAPNAYETYVKKNVEVLYSSSRFLPFPCTIPSRSCSNLFRVGYSPPTLSLLLSWSLIHW